MLNTERIAIGHNDVGIGKPLGWDVFRHDGSLAFHKGFVFSSRGILERVVKNGLYRESSRREAVSAQPEIIEADLPAGEPVEFGCAHQFEATGHAFSAIDSFATRTGEVLQQIQQGKVKARTELLKLKMGIGSFAESREEIFLGAVHTYFPNPISTIQPVYCAFLCDMTARILQFSEEERVTLRAAALTANVGMFEFHEALNHQAVPLTDQQKQLVYEHPLRGVELLEKVGVKDEVWLTAIAQHHEQYAGDGYPRGLKSDEISKEAKVIHIAERYLAMISKRAYSDPVHPKLALQEIYQEAEGDDKQIMLAFIKTLGVYPPGTRVKLANGEIAIVTSRCGKDTTKCTVASVCDADMNIYHQPEMRDTSDSRYSVKGFHSQPIAFRLPIELIW